MSKPADVVTNFRDDDITFFALVYQDHDDAVECLTDLRRCYPTSRVIIRSDGNPDARLAMLAKRFNVDFRGEPRIFGIENGGAIIIRMLELFLEKPTQYLLKIDPDTAIHRRFSYLPTRSGVFGTLQWEEVCPSIQGGCIVLTRDAVGQILHSGMLQDCRLSEPASFVNESPYFVAMADRANHCGLASFDWIIGWIASELGIPMYRFDEVNSCWRKAPPNPDLYAVTHPRARVTD